MVLQELPLHKQNHQLDAKFSEALHGDSSENSGGLSALMGKRKDANKYVVNDYFKHFASQKMGEDETDQDRIDRRMDYATLTKNYYDLATDLYEYGWGESFHFCRYAHGESFYRAIARHEHYLAHMMGLKPDMTVLDVGCGVGGPAREMVKFVDVNVIGLNNNDYQIKRAGRYARTQGLEKKMKFVKGDFMQMDFPPSSFDAVYAIEATVHAQSLVGVYSEIFKVLKPGGVFGVYEWLMTDKFEADNIEHKKIRQGIELGNGISNMETVAVCLAALKEAGFEVEMHEDLANRDDKTPWYWPIAGEMSHMASLFDFFTVFRMTKLGRGIMHNLLGALETVKLIPPGVKQAADGLAVGADSLVAGAKLGIFTPMYLVIARKPAEAASQ